MPMAWRPWRGGARQAPHVTWPGRMRLSWWRRDKLTRWGAVEKAGWRPEAELAALREELEAEAMCDRGSGRTRY